MRKRRHSRRPAIAVALVVAAMFALTPAPASASDSGTWCVVVRDQTLICVDK